MQTHDPEFSQSGVRAGDHRDDAAIQYVPELGGDLVMGLPIQSGLVLFVLLHSRGGKILITSGATRRAMGNNSSVKLWRDQKKKKRTKKHENCQTN